MKKYINLIIGLLIILTLMSPLAKLMKLDLKLDQGVFNYSRENYLEIDEFYEYQERQIENLYKDRLKNEIIDFIEEETKYKVFNIEIDLIENEDDNYEINYLEIEIGENIETVDKNIILIEKVPDIKIQNNNNKSESEDTILKKEFEELKKTVSKKYEFDKGKIVIIDKNKENGE